MPTTYLNSGPVALQETPAHPKPGQVVGAAPQWADESDGTYADAWISGRPGIAYTGRAYASLATLPTGATLVSTTLVARCQAMNEQNATGSSVYFRMWDAGMTTVVDETYTSLGALNTTFDLQLPLSVTNVAGVLAAGSIVSAERLTAGTIPRDHGIRVYELRLLVTYTLARRVVAHNQIVQRGSDGLGMTGGRRVVQGLSAQSGNRILGVR